MNLTSKYDLGQPVWYIYETHETVRAECPMCGESDMVTVEINGERERITCPRRHQWDHRPVTHHLKPWKFDSRGAIGMVRVTAVKESIAQQNDREPFEVEYMCVRSGVYSGNIYEEWRLFPSIETAQAECDRRNALMRPQRACPGCYTMLSDEKEQRCTRCSATVVLDEPKEDDMTQDETFLYQVEQLHRTAENAAEEAEDYANGIEDPELKRMAFDILGVEPR